MYNDRKMIAICTSDLDQKFHIRILQRMVRELSNLGYYTIFFSTDSGIYDNAGRNLADASIFDLIHFDKVDAVLIFSETIKEENILNKIVHNAQMAGVPVLAVGRELEDCYNVLYDEDTAFEKLVRHVVEYHDVKEVNFIAGFKDNEVSERRLEIYRRVLEENNILYEPDRMGYGGFWEGPTRVVMDHFIDENKMYPEAIICANDSMAIAACDYLREHNIAVPDDIIVTGFDGIEEGIKYTPGITTCVRNEVQDAKVIVRILSDLCEGRQVTPTTVLDYHIQLSQSCGCQKNHIFDAEDLIAELNHDVAERRFKVHVYMEMQDRFMTCKTDRDFWDLIMEYLPDDSFLCINEGLGIEPGERRAKPGGFYSEKLQAVGKLAGEHKKGDCLKKNVVPEFGKDVNYEKPVVILPIHFNECVVGYMGTWIRVDERIYLDDILFFLLSLNESAGYRLSEHDL